MIEGDILTLALAILIWSVVGAGTLILLAVQSLWSMTGPQRTRLWPPKKRTYS